MNVKEFLKVVISNVRANRKERLPLSEFFTKVEAYLKSLESMGLGIDIQSAKKVFEHLRYFVSKNLY